MCDVTWKYDFDSLSRNQAFYNNILPFFQAQLWLLVLLNALCYNINKSNWKIIQPYFLEKINSEDKNVLQ